MNLTSIVIPTIDKESERVRRCLESIADNGRGTRYEALVVEDTEREGFAATCNRGIAQARGAFVCLVNDDTVVYPGWLANMLAVMYAFPDVGLVGPVSDNVSGPQARLPIAGPVSQQVGRLVGFCLLIRRSVIDKIGGLDPSFGLNFEDDDYGLRAQSAGFKLRIALDSFVHHDCHATFTALGIDGGATMAKAWPIFQRKWNAAAIPDGYRVEVPPFSRERCYVALPAVVRA